MSESIYHTTLKLLKNPILSMKLSRFCHLLCNVINDIITQVMKSVDHNWFIDLLHGSMSLPDVTSCDKYIYQALKANFMENIRGSCEHLTIPGLFPVCVCVWGGGGVNCLLLVSITPHPATL